MPDNLSKLRQALIDRLLEEGAPELVGPMEACGRPVGLICTCCGENKEVKFHCQRRWCPECQPMISAQRIQRWSHAIQKLQWPLFVTLTMPNSTDPESIRHLKNAWRKLRNRKLMREKVRGGVATFEITNKGKGWHPHIHAVMDCRWLSVHVPEPLRTDPSHVVKQKCEWAQRELSSHWAECLGEEEAVVWVQRVKQVDSMAKEVLKYCMKGSELVSSPDPISPLLNVLRGTRMLAGWGSLHPLPSPDEEDQPSVECPNCNATKSFVPEEVAAFITRRQDSSQVGPYRA